MIESLGTINLLELLTKTANNPTEKIPNLNSEQLDYQILQSESQLNNESEQCDDMFNRIEEVLFYLKFC